MKKILKILLCVVLALLAAVVLFFLFLTVREYNPDDVTELEVVGSAGGAVSEGQQLRLITWNIGYGGLGAESDFFMDGGKEVQAADKATVERYLAGIKGFIDEQNPDILMLQEVDTNSQRSYGINESEMLGFGSSAHALNYSCDFVPFPMPPIGKVHSGVQTSSVYSIDSAERISLPCPFSWPVSTANLKRCLLVSYIPVENSDKQLVIVNLHLEAYDSGEGKIAQTKLLRDFISSEYEKGNYVIAGGDFNQSFPGGTDTFSIKYPELWAPGTLSYDILPNEWHMCYDQSLPTCRLLNKPFDAEDYLSTDYYVIDGFIISPNVRLERVDTVDLEFENSDHNPVSMVVTLLASEAS